MYQIHRKEVKVGEIFQGPAIEYFTFGYQSSRQAFSIWYRDDAVMINHYIIVGTGHPIDARNPHLIDTIVMPDGFHVFHLCEI